MKGKSGTNIGWELNDKLPVGDKDVDLARVPKCVYVQYYELDDMEARVPCKWKIGDLSPGVYPVTPITRTWLLGTDNKVSRFQLPLIPMYGRTAYSMQGRTLSIKRQNRLDDEQPYGPHYWLCCNVKVQICK